MSELNPSFNYTKQIERELKYTEANLMIHWNQARQRLIKQTEKLTQKEEKLAEMKSLIGEIVDCIFKDVESFFFDHEIQSKIDQKQLITAQDLDNEYNQSVLLNYWSQKKLKRFYQLKKLYLTQEAEKY